MGFSSGESGIRTHAPKKDDRISSAARYDHFDISPSIYGLMLIQHKQNLFYHIQAGIQAQFYRPDYVSAILPP